MSPNQLSMEALGETSLREPTFSDGHCGEAREVCTATETKFKSVDKLGANNSEGSIWKDENQYK